MLRINDEARNFTAETSQGTVNFHEWIGDSAILFSHRKTLLLCVPPSSAIWPG
jgi:alkyl hydroperoxide reductase subunit AhpC